VIISFGIDTLIVSILVWGEFFQFLKQPLLILNNYRICHLSVFLCTVQAYAMVERIGYPESILNDTELDAMYEEVNVYSIFDCIYF